MSLKKRVAIITGSSGIALETAKTLAKQNVMVHLCGIDKTLNDAAVKACAGLSVSLHLLDITKEDQIKQFVSDVTKTDSNINILINAAGVQAYGDIETTTPDAFDKTMDVNFRSYYLMSHYIYPFMKATGGAIVNVSSAQGHSNQNNVLAYATAKGAVHALTRAMAVDAAKDNIRENSVSPGSIRTPLLEYSAEQLAKDGQSVEDTIKKFGESPPIGRVGTMHEVAALITFLVSDDAGFCVGGDYKVDGGLTAQLGV